MQSAGTPPAPGGFTATPDGPGATKDLAAISLSWDVTSPNGPPMKSYTVLRRVDGGAWATLRTLPASTTRTTDQVRYDGRRYDYVVTATNGADLTSPHSAVQSFTSIGIPSTPSVTAATPTNDERARLTVRLGQPRAGGFASVRWQSSTGASGTYSCGSCPAGGTVTITTSRLATVDQTFTVTTHNGTRSSNPARSNSVQPYGPTPAPTAAGGSTSGRTVTYHWNLRTNGRPITKVVVTGAASHNGGPITSISANGDYAQDLTIHVRAYSEGGESPALTMTRRTADPPQPEIYNVRSGQEYNDPAGVGTCRTSTCPKVDYNVRNFPPNTSWTAVCHSTEAGASTPRTATIDGSGNGYSMPRYCLFARNVGYVRMTLSRDGRTITSPQVWFG